MKYLLKTFLLVFFAFMSAGCEKDDDEPELIIGKWTFEKEVYVDMYNGSKNTDTYPYDSGEYLEFKSDRSFLIMNPEGTQGGTWRISNNRIFFLGNDNLDTDEEGYEILKLTKSELQLYSKSTEGTDYYELTIYLSR
jgi:hypothetical protein